MGEGGGEKRREMGGRGGGGGGVTALRNCYYHRLKALCSLAVVLAHSEKEKMGFEISEVPEEESQKKEWEKGGRGRAKQK